MASGNYPFTGNAQTFANDFAVNDAYPAVALGGTESGALYYEDREVAGVKYFNVQNATFNKVSQSWLPIDITKPCSAMALTTGGVWQYLTQSAGVSPFTSWTVLAYVDATGAFNGNVNGSASIIPATSDMSGLGVYNVRHYGAKGDGSTDDTLAIQAAINAVPSSGGTVFFPSGRYVCGSLTINYSNTTLAGNGRGATILLKTGMTQPLVTATLLQAITVRDLVVSGQSSTYSSNPAVDAFSLVGTGSTYFTNVWCFYINGWCINYSASGSTGCFVSYVSNVNMRQTKAGLTADMTGVTPSNSLSLFAVNVFADTVQNGDGFYFRNCHDILLSQCSAYVAAGGHGIHLKGDCGPVLISATDTQATGGSYAALFGESDATGGAGGTIPRNVRVVDSSLEFSPYGAYFTSGTNIAFTGTSFPSNTSAGLRVDDPTTEVSVGSGCTFKSNGSASTGYDLDLRTAQLVRVSDAMFDSTAVASVFNIGNASNAVYVQNCNAVQGGVAMFRTNSPVRVSGLYGFTPRGAIGPPAVPATTVFLANPYPYDCSVYVTGGTVTAIQLKGNNGAAFTTGVTSGLVRVPWNAQIAITYSVAPTWAWFAE